MEKRLEAGSKLCGKAARILLGDLRWRRLGLLAFQDGPLLDSRSALVLPEALLLSLALEARQLGLRTVLLLNARRDHYYSLSGELGLSTLRALIGLRGPEPLYFGASTEGSPLVSLPRVRLGLEWLSANPGALARLVEAASPVRREVKEVDVSSISALSELLMDKLGPPSFKEDLSARVKGADKYQAAADALSTLSAFVTPSSLISVGLKYAAKFFSLVRERRKEEYKVFLDVWKKNVQEAFSEERLSTLIGEDGLEPLRACLDEHGLGIVIHDVIGTLHELFLPMFISQVASELGGEGSLVIVDGASYLAKLDWAVVMLCSLQEEAPGTRLACYLPTKDVPEYENLPSLLVTFTSERAGIFDTAPPYVDVLCEGKSAAFRAALLRNLEEAAKKRLSGRLAFALYDREEAPLLKLISLGPGFLARLKGKIKKG